jgi:2'-5' RNA ligase
VGAAPSTTLVILVPPAEAGVGRLRRRFDRPAARVIPPHITLLHPFLDPDRISQHHTDRLAEMLAEFEPFDFALSEIGWFGQRVVYLAPTPRTPFVTLIRRLAEEFPEHPPYGGVFPEVVPHLTVAEGLRPRRLRRVARRLERHVPVQASATEVCLMVPDTSGRMTVRGRFALGGADR